MPTPTHIVWLVANEPEVSRVGPGHTNIPQENRFSLHLRKELLKADILTVLGIGTIVHSAEQLCSRSCAKELHSAFLPFHNQVVGIMLVKAADSFGSFSCLSSAQRCVSEYWTATMHSEHPLLFLQCVAAARLEQPFSVRSTKQSAAAKMFFSVHIIQFGESAAGEGCWSTGCNGSRCDQAMGLQLRIDIAVGTNAVPCCPGSSCISACVSSMVQLWNSGTCDREESCCSRISTCVRLDSAGNEGY